MADYNLKWSFGNARFSNGKTIIFGIPALKSKDGFVTCPQAGACAAICYARQGFYRMPNVANAKEHNLKESRNLKTFIPKAIEDLTRLKHEIVRIHDAGDFYNQAYLDAWYEIARQFPKKFFYAYTKSLHLDLWTNKPKNFRIVQSISGKLDHKINKHKPHSRIFATTAKRIKAGYIDGDRKGDESVIAGETKIGLLYHGEANLTPPQERYFS
jgi:hypothetical protein